MVNLPWKNISYDQLIENVDVYWTNISLNYVTLNQGFSNWGP